MHETICYVQDPAGIDYMQKKHGTRNASIPKDIGIGSASKIIVNQIYSIEINILLKIAAIKDGNMSIDEMFCYDVNVFSQDNFPQIAPIQKCLSQPTTIGFHF